MFWKKIPTERIINLGKTAALLSKPIVTPAMYVVSVVTLIVANVGLVNTTANEPRFVWFFNGVFTLIVIGTFIGGYFRDRLAHWANDKLDQMLEDKLYDIYTNYEKMEKVKARERAIRVVEKCTFEAILEYIQGIEK